MDEVTKARALKRFNAAETAMGIDPKDALIAALAAIESGEIVPHQIAIVIGVDDPEHTYFAIKYFVAGSLHHWGLMGMMQHAMAMISEDSRR